MPRFAIMVQFKNFQGVILFIIFSSLGPAAVVSGLRCYNCNHTANNVGQSNSGCNGNGESSPLPSYLGVHVETTTAGDEYTDSLQEKETSFCFMITVKFNESIFGVYRGEGRMKNYTGSGVDEKCLDLTQTGNDHVQTYITDQTRSEWKNNTDYTNGRCSDGKGSVVTQNVTILGCYCTKSDGCNGANFNPSQEEIGEFLQPKSVQVITFHRCYPHDPTTTTTTTTETTSTSNAAGKASRSETTATKGFGIKLTPLQSTYMFTLGILIIFTI